jgi:hypothetical protein
MSKEQQKQKRRLYHFSVAKPSSAGFNIFDSIKKALNGMFTLFVSQ